MKYEEYMPECYTTASRRDLEMPEKKAVTAFLEKEAKILIAMLKQHTNKYSAV